MRAQIAGRAPRLACLGRRPRGAVGVELFVPQAAPASQADALIRGYRCVI